MENTDQQFNEIFDNYIKNFEKTPISQEQRAILPIIAFTVQGLPQQIKPYVQAAVDQGVNEAKILEIIYICLNLQLGLERFERHWKLSIK